MRYLKITNLFDKFAQCDYKGLDTEQFIPGSQVYDNNNSICLVATNENITSMPTDVTELLESDYNNQKQLINSSQQANDPIKQLQTQNAQILLALVNGGLM